MLMAAALGLLAVGVVLVLVGFVLHLRVGRKELARPGVWAVCGLPGAGKTYYMTAAAVDALRSGREVWANFGIDGATRYSSWLQLVANVPDGALVLMDEAQLFWPSHAWEAPAEVTSWCSQVRKRRVTLLWSAQGYDRVGKVLRHLTRGVFWARQMGGRHTYRLFDPLDMSGSTPRKNAKPEGITNIKRRREVEAAYDTEELVAGSCEWVRERRRV